MAFSQFILNARFGYGIRPGAEIFASAAEMVDSLRQPDPLAARFARPTMAERFALNNDLRVARRDQRRDVAGAEDRYDVARRKIRAWVAGDMQAYVVRATLSDNGFRERLVAFWGDHFTVSGKNLPIQLALGDYTNSVIRPQVSARFSDMLKAVVTHPAMLLFLDQNASIGPNSAIGQRRGKGLNENLAREILELHTMGVGAGYTQEDVRQFAELLTGLTLSRDGFRYNPKLAEPGSEVIFGATYGGDQGRLDDIMAFLDDLSLHPETAAHICRKLAVHFISDTPPADMVGQMTAAYRDSDGDLTQVYAAMLDHPAAYDPERHKVKWPSEYIVSTLRALNLGEGLAAEKPQKLRNSLVVPMQAMGMDLFRPAGPDGWPEEAARWITPPMLAARIEWAMAVAEKFGQETDPRALLGQVLGTSVSEALQVAVAGAESKWEGVALLLVSPEFNRR